MRRTRRTAAIALRKGAPRDLDALVALENDLFTTDRMSRRSLRHALRSPHAALLVADIGGHLAGYALVMFRSGSAVARLYSIGVTRKVSGRGVGSRLLAAAEAAALRRGCGALRLEVQESNRRAAGWYRRSGYSYLARHPAYYEDGSAALRLEKPFGRKHRTRGRS